MSCCSPDKENKPAGKLESKPGRSQTLIARKATSHLVAIPGGIFGMGYDGPEAVAADGEGPVREVEIAPFRMAPTTITNARFLSFVKETGYVSTAERHGWSFVFHLFLPKAVAAAAPAPFQAQWWRKIDGACWRMPEGLGSTIGARMLHPAVHMSLEDALAYCTWSGTRLPTENEWERAARGRIDGARYPWGDEFMPNNKHQCNIWQGEFPRSNTVEDGYAGTAPAKSFRANGFGLFNMTGNVWEWCQPSSMAATDADPEFAPMRGGSYLCHDSYCRRYRVSSRIVVPGGSTAGNTGFRIAV